MEQRAALESVLRKLPSIKEFRFESRQEAYARFKEQYKDAPALVSATTPESFSDLFQITLISPMDYCGLEARLREEPGVDAVTGPAKLLRPPCK